MSGISGVSGSGRHFSVEEEEALKRDESTGSILKRDTKASVEVYGTDRSWQATKEHQQAHVGVAGGLEIAHVAVEGAEVAGAICLGAAGAIGGPLIALGLGTHGLAEAHVKGEEQGRALAKDNVHAALVAVLDLPQGYKAARLDGEYRQVSKESGSPASKMIEGLRADPKGLAILQMHADRGMTCARDLCRSGMTAEAFFKANPKAAESYAKDPAFHEGFDAYLHAKAKLPAAQVKEMEDKLNARDGWYAQSQLSLRV